jgi:5-methylcytosine-specific restriction protein A
MDLARLGMAPEAEMLKRRRATGPTDATRQLVAERSGGYCERCGRALAAAVPMSVHHRKPRRAGGTSDPAVNAVSNLVAVCGSGVTFCHGEIESRRSEAYADGWLLHAGQDPAEVPVRLRGGPLVLLTVDGGYRSLL